eukprot:TRINITY_DN777984_c0_g1_i1.p1 TRINITY_DN777984_c0_g1~~TRINITY_DN777984_c0_g1_i1.p1  ORF type:complete len:233 (-),score=56.09 TRINITY_DN777984_c0_g1_i1:114-812(-)
MKVFALLLILVIGSFASINVYDSNSHLLQNSNVKPEILDSEDIFDFVEQVTMVGVVNTKRPYVDPSNKPEGNIFIVVESENDIDSSIDIPMIKSFETIEIEERYIEGLGKVLSTENGSFDGLLDSIKASQNNVIVRVSGADKIATETFIQSAFASFSEIHNDNITGQVLVVDALVVDEKYNEYEIAEYQICLWVSVLLVAVLIVAVYAAFNMNLEPEPSLYAKFQSEHRKRG